MSAGRRKRTPVSRTKGVNPADCPDRSLWNPLEDRVLEVVGADILITCPGVKRTALFRIEND